VRNKGRGKNGRGDGQVGKVAGKAAKKRATEDVAASQRTRRCR